MFLIASRLALSIWRRWFTRHSATRQAYKVLSVTAALFITAVIFIASDTGPLHDAIEDGVSGRLLPFFDPDALADALIAACRHPEASRPLRRAARAAALAKFSRAKGREGWIRLLREMGAEIPETVPVESL